jgi:prolyl oligopeptidase
MAAAACMAPLTDMARYHLSGLGEWWLDEFGDPTVPTELDWLLDYSPYHQVRSGTHYPAVLLVAEDDDERVDPAHARKMCAALQRSSVSGRPVLLRVHAAGGHGQRIRERRILRFAEALGFLAHHTGLRMNERVAAELAAMPPGDHRGEEVQPPC